MESPFAHLLEVLAKIEDPRRAEGKLYKLNYPPPCAAGVIVIQD